MTESGDLQQSLATMGLRELAFAFGAIGGYALVLNPLLERRGRLRAAAVALLGAAGFIAMAEPWVNGFILVVLAVAGIGVFSALVWAVSAACGLTQAVPASDGDSLEPGADVAPQVATTSLAPPEPSDATLGPVQAHPGSPAHSG